MLTVCINLLKISNANYANSINIHLHTNLGFFVVKKYFLLQLFIRYNVSLCSVT